MEWQFLVVLIVIAPFILFPLVFIWYLNVGGIYAAVREGRGRRILNVLGRAVRNSVLVLVPVAIYGFSVWYFLGNFGWPVALAVAIVLPIVLFVPVLIWAAVVSGLSRATLEALRRRTFVSGRRTAGVSEEPAARRVTINE